MIKIEISPYTVRLGVVTNDNFYKPARNFIDRYRKCFVAALCKRD